MNDMLDTQAESSHKRGMNKLPLAKPALGKRGPRGSYKPRQPKLAK